MKKCIISLISILAFSSTVYAIALFDNISKISVTKNSAAIPVQSTITVLTNYTACRILSNGTGTGFPITSGTRQEYNFPPNVSNVVFNCNTTVGRAIYVAK